MKRLTLLSIVFALSSSMTGQVSIGNDTGIPYQFSILDLTNTLGKGLLLPKATAFPTDTSGLVFFKEADSLIYYNLGAGNWNALSPWKYKYGSVQPESVYFDGSGKVGIGISTTADFKGKLTISGGSNILGASNDAPYLWIGPWNGVSSKHLLIDDDEIMTKVTASNNAGNLLLQKKGGTVTVGSGVPADADNATLNVNGAVQQFGSDLLPKGSVILWYGTFNAAGNPFDGATVYTNWIVCDGAAGTPNLNGQLVQGMNMTIAGNSTAASNGQSMNKTITPAMLPPHSHTINHDHPAYTGGSHSHNNTWNGSGGSGHGYDDESNCGSNRATSSETVTIDLPMTAGMNSGNGPGSSASLNVHPAALQMAYIIKIK